MSPTLKGSLLGLAGFGLFSLADAAIKLLGRGYPSVQIMAYAGLFAFPLIALLWLREGGRLRPVHPWLMALRTGVLIVNGLVVTYAFTVLPLAEAYAIFFTMPLMLTVLAWPMLGERIDPVAGVAVLLGLGGVLVALDPQAATLGLGHLAAVAGAVSAAVHYLIVRKTGGVESRVAMLVYPQLGQALAALALLPGRHVPMDWADLAIVGGLALAGFGGTLLLFAAYRAATVIVVAPTQYSQIAWAALYGALFFAEPMDLRTAFGMAIIAGAGLVVVMRQDNRARHATKTG